MAGRHILPDILLTTDACLDAAGGVCRQQFFHSRFPQNIKDEFPNIAHRELIAVILAVKLWKNKIANKVLHLFCDNEPVVTVINTGRSKDQN